MISNRKNYIENINSLLLSIVLMSELLITPFIYVFKITNGANFFVLLIELILIIIGLFLDKGKSIRFTLITSIVFLIFIFSAFWSILFNKIDYTIAQLFFYFVIPFYVSTKKVNLEKMLKYSIYLSLTSIVCISSLFKIKYDQLNQISMGNSYAVCTSCILCLFYFAFFRKKSNLFIIAGYFLNAFYCYKLLLSSTRGAILAFAIAILIIIILKIKFKSHYDCIKNTVFFTKNNKKVVSIWKGILVFLAIGIGFLILNYDSVILLLIDFSSKYLKSVPSFLYKMQLFISSNDVSNGRIDLYNIAFDLISRKAGLGYGIKTFSLYTPYPWPHNVFIQFLFENGVFIGGFLCCFLVYAILFAIFNSKMAINKLILLNVLLVLAFPRYMVSNDIWNGVHLWVLLGYFSKSIDLRKKYSYQLHKYNISTI